ncbi:hypothetical protein CRU98_04645 [Arcobacter sp. CECT 8986]|uniref:VirB4 family type IV secretion/conjugal transfer ATPase n=1 Tax=Arcobacter sp. CECT 8986 TaxID=2044507 RepID=UPI001009EFF4|nr:hypothetical protein [Arcobacter sp. CECT 8986]RXK00451.1 hypothetical protein CRU98_04645 [Arcobacter sp. CECT 8986]
MSILPNLLNKLLLGFSKPLYSISEDNNILGKFDEYNLVTKDENFVTMFEISGISYNSLNDEKLVELLELRNIFINSVNSLFNISIFQNRDKKEIDNSINLNTNNDYADNLIKLYNNKLSSTIYENKFYIAICTSKKNLKNFFDLQKDKITSSDNEKNFYLALNERLNKIATNIINQLNDYQIKRLSSSETLNFYASYCNMKKTKVNAKLGLLQDSYINTNLKFEKDYIIHQDDEKRYSKFLSVKAYDTNEIDSNLTKELLSLNSKILVCENITSISKDAALTKMRKFINTSSDIVREELEVLRELIKTDRENLLYYSLSILITTTDLKELKELTKHIEVLFSKYGIKTVVENKFVNLKTLYFSFFPGRSNLNTRKRLQSSTAISVLNSFEQDIKGRTKNSFGDDFIAYFKTLNNQLFRFNFHVNTRKKGLGHTLVIAPTESGKTTLMSFLMVCLLKFDINILAFDKRHGMYNFCNFFDGSYQELNEEFTLNPFSLPETEENINFLKSFLKKMAEIDSQDSELILAIENAIRATYRHKNNLNVKLEDFINNLEKFEGLEEKFKPFLGGIFDNEKCSLNFEKKITILGMDTILKDKKLAFLVSLYSSHKLQNLSLELDKDFFVFWDELKDYITNKDSAEIILEQKLEVRKTGGVITEAVQNLDFFDILENKDSYLENIGHYIIFPTKSPKVLKRLEEDLDLSRTEIEFLSTSDLKNNHEILLKNRVTGESIFLNIDLSSLGNYLNVFNSDSSEVKRLKKIKTSNPENWREDFLNGNI